MTPAHLTLAAVAALAAAGAARRGSPARHLPQMTDEGVYPAGLVDYLLIEDRLTCEIVPDGTHVHPVLVEKALRCKPEAGIVCVTDSNYGAGLPSGRYTLPASWGEVRIDGPFNGVRQVNRDMGLAGSALTPLDGFQNLVRTLGVDLAAASRLWSGNPARLMRLNKGRIASGVDADLIVLDADLELRYTVVRGQVVYRA